MKLTAIPKTTGQINIPQSPKWALPNPPISRLVVSRTGDVVEMSGRIQPSEELAGSQIQERVDLVDPPLGFRPKRLSGATIPAGQAYILSGPGAGYSGVVLSSGNAGASIAMPPNVTDSWYASHIVLVHAMWRTEDPMPELT